MGRIPRWWGATFVWTMLFSLLVNVAAARPSQEQIIEGFVREWIGALTTRDAAVMERLLAPEFRAVTYNGHIIDRATDIATVTASPEFRFEDVIIHDLDVEVYGRTAIVRGAATVRERMGDAVTDTTIRVTQTWLKRRNRWQVVAEQATRIE